MSKMVQYGLWPDCSNSCDFCLLPQHGKRTSIEDRLLQLNDTIANIKTIDWIDLENDFRIILRRICRKDIESVVRLP